MMDYLENTTIDWSDFEKASHDTRALVSRLANDKKTLQQLIEKVPKTKTLFSKCERHQLLDYITIYDALDRGFRIRIHLSTAHSFDRPHDHRFSFTSKILCGEYTHIWHKTKKAIYDNKDDDLTKQWMNIKNPDPTSDIKFTDLTEQMIRRERASNCYSLHHSVVHSTITTPDTVSLFLRGPHEKIRSIIMDKETKTFWWRFGRTDEPIDRRNEKEMSKKEFDAFVMKIQELNII